jgi:hypothetical protein
MSSWCLCELEQHAAEHQCANVLFVWLEDHTHRDGQPNVGDILASEDLQKHLGSCHATRIRRNDAYWFAIELQGFWWSVLSHGPTVLTTYCIFANRTKSTLETMRCRAVSRITEGTISLTT